MKLQRLRFKCLKGFGECVTAPDRLFDVSFDASRTIFVGRNGGGKSSILEALSFLSYGYDQPFTRACHQQLRFPPYTAATQLEISLQHEGVTFELSYGTEKYDTIVRKSSPMDAIDSNADCEDFYRLSLREVSIDGAPVSQPLSVGTFVFRSENDTSELDEVSKARMICLRELHSNCWQSYFSPTKAESFAANQHREVFAFETFDSVRVTSPKSEVRRLLQTHFSLDLLWDTLPNEGTLDATTVRDVDNDALYPIAREASGFVWLMQLLLGALNRKGNFIVIDEPESFLHPAFQIRLQRALAETGTQLIIATHSAAVIDQTTSMPGIIYHVQSRQGDRTIQRIESDLFSSGLVEDLGIRPSQVLQANGVVWVEGVTDRLYVNRWIDLYCAKHRIARPIEGVHYSMLEYGGRCLSHLSFEEVSEQQDLALLMRVLRNNRNNYVIMDSDKRHVADILNDTKMRIADELGTDVVWVTWGKEIENYLPNDVLPFRLERFDAIAEKYREMEGKPFKKLEFARKIVAAITPDNWRTAVDLETDVGTLVRRILGWAELP